MTKKDINKSNNSEVLQKFTFPEENLVIEAINIEEAMKKLKIILSKK